MGHNLAIVNHIKKLLAPFCSSRDSASDDISVIASNENASLYYGEGQSCFLMKERKPVHCFVIRVFFSISYKSMDAYRVMFVLYAINGWRAWHQGIAWPF